MSILVLVGTKAQYIKTAPVLIELRDRSVSYRLVYTGQHSETFSELEAAFGLPTADDNMVPGTEADSRSGILVWASRFMLAAAGRIRRGEWRGASWGVVHGDTASTLLSALVLRIAGIRVAHVEAGLRSPSLLSPFPEEIVRRVVSRLAALHLAPSVAAAANLAGRSAEVVETGGNTMRDALRFALSRVDRAPKEPSQDYAIATLHRSENLSRRAVLDLLLEEIVNASRKIQVMFVLHPVTRRALGLNGWLARLEAEPSIRLVPRTDYVTFVHTMLGARFLMTDGGSNQEEAAMLGLPTLVLRAETERSDGLDEGIVVMSNMDRSTIQEFVDIHSGRQWQVRPVDAASPSATIVDHLLTA